MNSEYEFKTIRGKANYGYDHNVTNIGQALKMNKVNRPYNELKIIQCPNLISTDGVEACKNLISLNISSNKIRNIDSLRFLVHLKLLDVKANRIKSLEPIAKLSMLTTIDASFNIIESLSGFGKENSQLQTVILFDNNLRELEELEVFKTFTKLTEICFEKNNKSNPFCQNQQLYYQHLRQHLQGARFGLQKVDDISGMKLKIFFEGRMTSVEEQREEQSNYKSQDKQSSSAFINNKKIFMTTQGANQGSNLASPKIMHLTQRQYDLQRLVDIKDEAIQEMRQKNVKLQMTNTNLFKDSLKKQVEYQRVFGQVSELARAIDQKDSKINQLHRRIEEMLKINSAANSSGQARVNEIQKLRKMDYQLKIENAKVIAVNKDQQQRLKQLQNKALSSIEDKSQKIEQLRRRNQDVMKQNYQMQKVHDEYKDRIRQLSQLLKEWEFKYEQKIKQMEMFHHTERSQIIKELENKEEYLVKNHQETVRRLYQECQDKIKALQVEYTQALETSIQKFINLRTSYDEKVSSESELRNLLKAVMSKKNEQQQTINECQEVILSSRKKIQDLMGQNQTIIRQLSELRTRYQMDVKQLQEEVSKLSFERNKQRMDNKDLKASNQYLQTHFDNLNTKEKELQEMEQRIQNLQSALDTKNVMLDDKVDTIDNLKLQLQNSQKQLEGKMDMGQFQKLSVKYRKNKDKVKQLQQKMLEVISENKQINEKLQIFGSMELQFGELKDIMYKQQTELNQKKTNIDELVEVIEKLRSMLGNYQQEIQVLKREKTRLLASQEEKEIRWNRSLREKERQFQERQAKMKEELGKLKDVVGHLNQISNLTKGISF